MKKKAQISAIVSFKFYAFLQDIQELENVIKNLDYIKGKNKNNLSLENPYSSKTRNHI